LSARRGLGGLRCVKSALEDEADGVAHPECLGVPDVGEALQEVLGEADADETTRRALSESRAARKVAGR
jgi:hypothetical protein